MHRNAAGCVLEMLNPAQHDQKCGWENMGTLEVNQGAVDKIRDDGEVSDAIDGEHEYWKSIV